MNWDECRYKDIVEKFSEDDIAKLIDAMIQNLDSCGEYYAAHQVIKLINDSVSNSLEILGLVQETAQREIREIKEIKEIDPIPFGWESEEYEDINIMLREEAILNSIMLIIKKDAIKKNE